VLLYSFYVQILSIKLILVLIG